MANTHCKNLSNTYRFEFHDDELFFSPCQPLGEKCLATNATTIHEFRSHATERVKANPRHRCFNCYFIEENEHRESDRRIANQYIPDDALDGAPYILDFQITRRCNAACAHCGPFYSSLWKKIKGIPVTIKNFTHQYDQALSMITLDNVRLVKFNGGEPLLGDEHLQVLTKLNPTDVTLYYETNGSVEVSQDVIDAWRPFKQITLAVTIDAVGDRFEYLRWPLEWGVVSENVQRLINIAPNVTVTVKCTVHPLNAFYVSEIDEWLAKINAKHGSAITVEYRPCYAGWDIAATPLSLVNDIKEKFTNHPVCNLYKNRLPNLNHSINFLKHVGVTDQDRGSDWRLVFPEVVKYFE